MAGRALTSAADAVMLDRGVQAPVLFAAMYAPGFQTVSGRSEPNHGSVVNPDDSRDGESSR